MTVKNTVPYITIKKGYVKLKIYIPLLMILC